MYEAEAVMFTRGHNNIHHVWVWSK